MRQSFNDWIAHCKTQHGGALTYTGSASRPWGAFKEAVATRGPFFNAREQEVRDWDSKQEERRRTKWQRQKESQRDRQRTRLRAERKLPTVQYFINLQDERDRRVDALLEVLGRADQPKSRSKVPEAQRESTARIVANAWAVRELSKETGQELKPGTIARLMAENGLNAGVPYATLKARIKNDLVRADECERDGIWRPFDPNADLHHPTLDGEDEFDELWHYSDEPGAEARLPEMDGDLRSVLREIEVSESDEDRAS
jgi:hypothetical protein